MTKTPAMITKKSNISWLSARRALFFAAFIFTAICLPQTSQAADNYTIHVTVEHYDGEVEHDGHHYYKVKVKNGDHQYDVYLHDAMPELAKLIHKKVNILVSRDSNKWLTLSSHDHSSKISSVKRIHHD